MKSRALLRRAQPGRHLSPSPQGPLSCACFIYSSRSICSARGHLATMMPRVTLLHRAPPGRVWEAHAPMRTLPTLRALQGAWVPKRAALVSPGRDRDFLAGIRGAPFVLGFGPPGPPHLVVTFSFRLPVDRGGPLSLSAWTLLLLGTRCQNLSLSRFQSRAINCSFPQSCWKKPRELDVKCHSVHVQNHAPVFQGA